MLDTRYHSSRTPHRSTTVEQQGFVLTRHWRDTSEGTEVSFWLATDAGPRYLRLPAKPSVAFIPTEQRSSAEAVLKGERSIELRPLELCDFHHRPVLGPVSYTHLRAHET